MSKPWERDWSTSTSTSTETPENPGAKPWERNWDAEAQPEPKKARDRTVGDIVGDVAVTALKGAVGLPESLVGLADIPTGGRVGRTLENAGVRFGDAKEILDGMYSPAQQEANRQVREADGFVDTLKAAVENPSVIATTVGESVPQMLGAAGIARSVLGATSKVAPWAAGAIGEGVIGAGAAASQIRSETEDGLLTPKQSLAAAGSGVGTALLGAAGGKLAQRMGVPDVDTMLASGKLDKTPAGFAKAIVGAGISEGVFEELPQSVQEQMWQNFALDKPLTEGVGNSAALGLLSGMAMGGAGGGFNAAMAAAGRDKEDEQNQAPGAAGQTQPTAGEASSPAGGPGAAPGGASARGSATGVETVGVGNTEQAERALREPVNLTALDRANEIGSELARITERRQELAPENGYGPAFDQERAELDAQAEALSMEREAIARTWPKAERGAPTSFSTEAGVRLDGEYALMDASDLVTSHDEGLRSNPLYPQELQPRDRSRQASELQVSGIVQKLDPARLGISADAATGAPIVGADGLVESGNARTIALKRVYQANGQKAEDYKQFLRDNAAQFGLSPTQIDAMEKPVLVRVRSTPVNRAEFARQANASTVAEMSPSEQALSDAKRLSSLEGLNPDDAGDFDSSYDFIRQFMGMLPVTEQGRMLESDGRLSTYGYRRIQNAVLAKAYGDSPTLRRMTESRDDNLRNVSKALTRVAPTIAAARDRIQAGTLNDADIAPDLLQAVEGLSALKDKGWSVAEELRQQDLSGPKYSPEAAQLLEFLSDNLRSPRRIAEFLQRYYEALEAAGDPNQGSMFDDGPAPTRAGLLQTAKGESDGNTTQDPERGVDREGARADAQAGGQPQDAPSDSRGDQGDGPARAPAQGGQQEAAQGQAGVDQPGSEWVSFPADSGTLGIPRRDMPQVKGEHRGALIQFLNARGISHQEETVSPDSLKPTQAEYSSKKVAKFAETGVVGVRSVLVSADDYVLDGHHQWMGHKTLGEDIPVIRLDAPIVELLAVVNQFPSVRRSEGGLESKRAAAVADFKAALADLADIASKHTRATMLPENTPGLMPTLVKLFDAGIRIVGTDLKAATKWVKDQMKADERTRKIWNKIDNATYQKAALQALEAMDAPAQAGLFDSPDQATEAVQRGLFDSPSPEVAQAVAPVVKVAMIDGRPYDMERDNFKAPPVDTFMDEGVLKRADGYVEKYYKDRPPVVISDADRQRAEALLQPLIKRAGDVKADYDQKIIDIRQRTKAIGQMIAPLKKIGRSVEKLVNEEKFDINGMKDILRSTIVVESYADAQQVLDEIEKEFKLLRKPKNRTGEIDMTWSGGALPAEDRQVYGGYADVMVNVVMPNGVIAEIQINVPQMLAAKEGQGHKLYEAQREAPKDSALGREIGLSMTEFYQAAFDSAQSRAARAADKKPAGSEENEMPPGGAPARPAAMPGRGSSEAPSSDSLNQPSPGIETNQSPPKVGTNKEPTGNLSGTRIASPLDNNVPQISANGYTAGDLFGDDDANARTGEGRAQGEEPGAAQGTDGQAPAEPVRRGSGRSNQRTGNDADAGAAAQGGVGQAGPDGVRGADEDGRGAQPRTRAGRNAGVPAGRDIPPKSGRNYAFGPDDLTYQGSWFKKAEQNVEAIELLQALKKEGRQATREEQAKLAKFIGWGSSEMANNLFGDKPNKTAEAQRFYTDAVAAFEQNGGRAMSSRDRGFYAAFQALNAASKEPLNYYQVGTITKDMLEKAKPSGTDLKWLALRDRLKKLMTADQWAEASRSTQYAHYTSKEVVRSMWKAMDRMGFKGGSILEPGAGIGVFPGLMPEAMAANSIYTGIEFDTFTGEILQQLFPDERILVESFVDSRLPKNFYDVAVGNPPFSGTKILSDPEYAKRSFSLHDYFFAKSIDRVKPGGLVVYVTSRYTMDKLDDKARAYLADRADLVGAIRLPQTAFKQNAGTEVVTDVIFLRKKVEGETFEGAKAWGKSVPITVNGNEYNINEYFAANPSMVLGTHSDAGSMYKDREYTVAPLDGDIEAHFAKAVEQLPSDIYHAQRGSAAEAAKVREIDFNPKAQKEGNYYVTDKGALMIREGGVGQRVELKNQKDVELIKDYVPLRDALKQAHYDQLNDGNWESSLAALQKAYEAFTKKHGQINQFTTKVVKTKGVDEDTGETYTDEAMVRVYPLLKKLEDDPDYTLVAALEKINDDTGEIKPSDFLTKRVLGKPQEAAVNTPIDALLSSLNDVGRVDIPLIAQRVGLTEADTIEALGSSIYEDPEDGWQTADQYLSGNVKRKLEAAREAVKADKRYERNVTALEAVQPPPKTPSQINIGIGMNWVPGEVYGQFLYDVARVRADVEFNERTRQWIIQEHSGGKSMLATADWGTGERSVTDLMEAALTGRPVRVTRTVGSGSDRKTEFDPAATEAANLKLEALKERFSSWVWEDSARTDRLVQLYNDKFNTTVSRSFDGKHLTLPGTSKTFEVFDHVKRGAWRIVQDGNTYLAHAVGSGKTFQMVIANMEMKRLGLVKKPMVVVPNHMLKQFASEWQQLYPAARLMVADENNFHTDNRRRFVSRVALSDLDGVVITHSAFKLLDLDPKFKAKMIEEQLDYMRAAMEEAEAAEGKGGKKSPRIKQIEKKIENLEEKLKAAMSSTGKDTNVRFDELGVDFLMVDEAHEFRKLDFATTRQVKGISPQGSARAFDLYMKSRYLEERTPGRSLVMASGTPVTNTLAELYNVQRFMDRQALIDRGIEDFDSWAAMFGRERTVLEPNAAGKYEPVTRFSKFVNVPELTQMFREFADVLTPDHLAKLLGDKRPKVAGGSRVITVTPKTEAYADFQGELAQRVEESRAWKPSKEEPNNPDPMIRIIGDGRLAAIDMRFMDPSLPSDPDSKLNRMIDDVVKAMQETADIQYRGKNKKDEKGNEIEDSGDIEPTRGAAMMVFSDLGFGAGVAESRGFNARAWFEKRLRDAGIPMNQVAFMSDYKKSADKLKLFKDVNAGRVRLLVGSSKNMGTGVNAQQRLLHLFHLDSPWYPADLEQREGRIIRQGNKNKEVHIHAYAAKGTYDENMWKMLASKQFFIDQALSGDENLRELEDLDSQSQYDLAAAMVAEDPRILQLAGAKAEIEKLQRLYRAHEDQRARFKSQFAMARSTVEWNESRLPEAEKNSAKVQDLAGEKFRAKVTGKTYDERAKWGEALIEKFKALTSSGESKPVTIGEISGFPIVFGGETVDGKYTTKAILATPEPVVLVRDVNDSPVGMAVRATNAISDVARLPAKMRERITEARAQMDALQGRLEAPFAMAGMLADKVKEVTDLEATIAAEGKPRTWRVERRADGKGFDVQATSALDAITQAMASNGGTADDWTAVEPKDVKPAEDTRLARGPGSTMGGMDVKALDALVKRIQAKMPNLPKVHVLADPSKAPKLLREYITRQDAWSDVEGAFHLGELYLFASGLSDPLRAEHVLAEHEAAHYGLRALLGSKLETAMNLVYAQNGAVRKAASELQKRGKLTNAEATEEVIVDLPTSQLATLKGWRRVVEMAAEWLGSRGFEAMAQKLTNWLDGTLTDQQRADLLVAELVGGAREFVAGRRAGSGRGVRGTRLSATLAEDIAKQEQWLQSEARARGFKDIEDLLAKDYPLFEKLAALWRQKNPADTLLSRGMAAITETPAFKRWFGRSKIVEEPITEQDLMRRMKLETLPDWAKKYTRPGGPKVMYHATISDIGAFKSGPSGAIYLAPEPSSAFDIATQRHAKTLYFRHKPPLIDGMNVMPVYVRAENPFDYENRAHADALVKHLEKNWPADVPMPPEVADPEGAPGEVMASGLEDRVGMGDYLLIESKTALDWIKSQGFDSFYVAELQKDGKNLAVFSPEQIKSAIGNRGTFDPTNPDIRLSRDPDAYAKAVRLWQEAMGRAPAGQAAVGVEITMPMPTVYEAIGLKPAKLSLPVRYMQGIREKHRDVPANVLKDLPQLLSDPLVVFPHVEGGYRAVIDAQTAKGEAIVVGISSDGRVQTVTPMHDMPNDNGRDRLAFMVEKELAKTGVKVYARNKEALANTRASRRIGSTVARAASAVPSSVADPASRALLRTPRDKAIVWTREKVVNKVGDFGPGIRLSRATPEKTAAERADEILSNRTFRAAPIDAAAQMLTRVTGVERLTGAIYNRAGRLLEAFTPEKIKAGVVSDYGVPQAVIDQRIMLQGRQRVQLRKAGALIEKLSTLTRAESRVAYEWMNMDGSDPKAYLSAMQGLPEESVQVLTEVQKLIDQLSREAVRLGQLSPDAYERNKFAYLRRSYAKHILEQTSGEKAKRSRVLAILGDQYKGRGITELAAMDKIKNAAPEWWGRKLAKGKADKDLKGEKFIRLEKRDGNGARTKPLDGMEGKGDGRLREVAYWPAGEKIPTQYSEWTKAGTFEVRDTKGANLVLWRDFTKEEREMMGEVDEARFAIAKTLHGMIHDVEVGRYLEWMSTSQAKKEGETIPGRVVEASERMRDTFATDEWVQVPESKIPGTNVLKYGKLAGRYIPGPVWNDIRQVIAGRFQPFGETYAKVLLAWKLSKTALSPAVHMNNVMSSFIMADWHDVGAGHVYKALRIILAASKRDGKGLIGNIGNVASRAGIVDREAAREILDRYSDSGGEVGSWIENEIRDDQLAPLLESLEKELLNGDSVQAHTGVFAALQHMLMLRFPSAWEAFKPSLPGRVITTEASNLIDLYQSEDDVFRLAAWIKAKEEGLPDIEAGRRARKSFLDYHINAPWIAAMRQTVFPFISFTYRAVPMMLEVAAKKPHKLLKLMMVLGVLNALGAVMAGGDDEEERKLLPEEKAGRIWGIVPKLIRMPWNDQHGSPVYLDIRRFIPVGDVFDFGMTQAALPIPPWLQLGGPLSLGAELWANKSFFTGKPITLETDTPAQATAKVLDHLYKFFAPNILGLPNTHATEGVVGSMTGRTDAFGREMSSAQAVASAFGVKLGSYPPDVLRRNLMAKTSGQIMEIDRNISQLRRQYQTGRLSEEDYREQVLAEQQKKAKIQRELAEKMR